MGGATNTIYTVRVSNLPPQATAQSVKEFFNNRTKGKDRHVRAVTTPCTHGGNQHLVAAVTFQTEEGAKAALKLSGQEFVASSTSKAPLYVDNEFMDLTTIYCHPKADTDIVVAHGLSGHAWRSFTSLNNPNDTEYQWLATLLPQYLEEKGIHARIMLYGYNANIFVHNAMVDVSLPASNLQHQLYSERLGCPNRPLFFIAHSLGGIVVKQTICALIKNGVESGEPFLNPVRGCLFFGVPHEGAASAKIFGPLLKMMGGLPLGLGPSSQMVKDLRPKSDKLPVIQDTFSAYRREYDIAVLSCWETLAFNGHLVVTRQSAVMDYPKRPEPYGLNAHHMDMVRFAHHGHPGFTGIMNSFCKIIKTSTAAVPTIDQAPCVIGDNEKGFSGVAPGGTEVQQRGFEHDLLTPWFPPRLAEGEEEPYAALEDYDTVIVIDDSGSMAGSLWTMTSKVLAQLVRRAVRFDTNGIDVYFFNSKKAHENVGSTRQVMQVFNEVRPQGTTPTYDRLHSHLESYMRRFKNDPDIKKLNLVFITDGPPDDEAEDDIKDEIASVAKRLEALDANKRQVGLQFVQVGNDKDATEFFEWIDDHIKKDRGLDRDMVDTTHFDPSDDIEWVCKKILLGAIKRGWDKQTSHATKANPTTPHAQHSPPLETAQSPPLDRHPSLPIRQSMPPDGYAWQQPEPSGPSNGYHSGWHSGASTSYAPSMPSGVGFAPGQPTYPNGWPAPTPAMQPSQSLQGRPRSNSPPGPFELQPRGTFPTSYRY